MSKPLLPPTVSISPSKWEEEPRAAPIAALEPGTLVGRHLVIEELGRGAMGVVVRAYDPRLEREVALKSVRTDKLGHHAQVRMVLEARAMAKINHPNVLSVYDVAVQADRVVVTMEYVEGRTLAAWLASHPDATRPGAWRSIARRFIDAGRGLAAAHACGLLHRDFKPSNVLIGSDGRVCVADFGIARQRDSQAPQASRVCAASSPGTLVSDIIEDVTVTGTVLGTPLYMAPEQHMGLEVEPTADQYAFCVALWEAFTGSAPFEGSSTAALLEAKLAGPPPWPSHAVVPRRIVDALQRGLMVAPSERWPSMNDLLEVLAKEPQPRRGRAGPLLAGLTALTGASVAWFAAQTPIEEPCSQGRRALGDAWSPARRAATKTAMLSAGVPFATATWTRTAQQIDGYASAWLDRYADACEAVVVRGERTTRILDLQMACLRGAKVELDAATTVLARADAQIVTNAHAVFGALPDLERCADVEALQEDVAPPASEEASSVAALRERLAAARALREAGKLEDGWSLAETADASARTLRYAPLRTQTALELALSHMALGRYAQARVGFREALTSGLRWKQLDEASTAAARLVLLLGYEQGRPEEALRYAATAAGLVRRPGVSPRFVAQLHHSLAAVFLAQSNVEKAEREARKALSVLENAGESPLLIARVRTSLAVISNAAGKHGTSVDEHRAALEALVEGLGPEHPDVAIARSNLGSALYRDGHNAQAQAQLRAGLEVLRATLGDTHDDVATQRSNLASVLITQGRLEEAEHELRSALRVVEHSGDPLPPEALVYRSNLAQVLLRQGRLEEAESEQRQVLEGALERHGDAHAFTGGAYSNLGAVLVRAGRHREAERAYRRGIAIQSKSSGRKHPHTAGACSALGMLLIDEGRAHEALPFLEDAWSALASSPHPEAPVAETAFALARALWATSTDRTRALDLAHTAHARLTSNDDALAAEVQAWLRAR